MSYSELALSSKTDEEKCSITHPSTNISPEILECLPSNVKYSLFFIEWLFNTFPKLDIKIFGSIAFLIAIITKINKKEIEFSSEVITNCIGENSDLDIFMPKTDTTKISNIFELMRGMKLNESTDPTSIINFTTEKVKIIRKFNLYISKFSCFSKEYSIDKAVNLTIDIVNCSYDNFFLDSFDPNFSCRAFIVDKQHKGGYVPIEIGNLLSQKKLIVSKNVFNLLKTVRNLSFINSRNKMEIVDYNGLTKEHQHQLTQIESFFNPFSIEDFFINLHINKKMYIDCKIGMNILWKVEDLVNTPSKTDIAVKLLRAKGVNITSEKLRDRIKTSSCSISLEKLINLKYVIILPCGHVFSAEILKQIESSLKYIYVNMSNKSPTRRRIQHAVIFDVPSSDDFITNPNECPNCRQQFIDTSQINIPSRTNIETEISSLFYDEELEKNDNELGIFPICCPF